MKLIGFVLLLIVIIQSSVLIDRNKQLEKQREEIQKAQIAAEQANIKADWAIKANQFHQATLRAMEELR